MKKAVSLMLVLISLFISCAAEDTAHVELANPKRVSLYAPEQFDNANLPVDNELVYDDDNYITGRRIVNTTSASQNNSALRFRTNDYTYGARRWKNSFIWEFDFVVDTLEQQFIITCGKSDGAKIKFAKDSKTDQFYLSWEGTSVGISHAMSVIWGHKDGTLLQYGKTYHIRIDMDATEGGNVFVTFSDPENGYTHTSSQPTKLTYSMDAYVTTGSMYTFNISALKPVDITTSNELFYYDEYYTLSKTIETEESTVRASVSLMDCINYSKDSERTVPYLFLGIYDKNGALVGGGSADKAIVPKQANADNEFLTAQVNYSVSADVNELEDGEYTAKLCLWRSEDEMIINTAAEKMQITVADGIIQ